MNTNHPDNRDTCQVAISTATWRDLNAVRRLEKICFPEDAWPLLEVLGVLALPNVLRLKGVVQGALAGFVAVEVRRREDLAWVATIGVLPEYRRRGIATALMRETEARLDVARLRLSVRASNRQAIKLYQVLGFHQIGVWGRYYRGGEDAHVMEKRLGV